MDGIVNFAIEGLNVLYFVDIALVASSPIPREIKRFVSLIERMTCFARRRFSGQGFTY